jgi:hypothetical protein
MPGYNLAENSMRPVAVGRKNWLHVGSARPGPKVVAILSVVESCRGLNVPVKHYRQLDFGVVETTVQFGSHV